MGLTRPGLVRFVGTGAAVPSHSFPLRHPFSLLSYPPLYSITARGRGQRKKMMQRVLRLETADCGVERKQVRSSQKKNPS